MMRKVILPVAGLAVRLLFKVKMAIKLGEVSILRGITPLMRWMTKMMQASKIMEMMRRKITYLLRAM
jgi:hypothetical protein